MEEVFTNSTKISEASANPLCLNEIALFIGHTKHNAMVEQSYINDGLHKLLSN